MPIRILLSGHYRGAVVRGFRQDSEELFPAGDREATVWLAYSRDVTIDEVQIKVWNANAARVAVADFPMAAAWSGASGSHEDARRAEKSWVAELTPGQRQRMAEASSAAGEPARDSTELAAQDRGKIEGSSTGRLLPSRNSHR